MTGRSVTLVRVLSLLRVLETGHGFRLDDLAQRFGVTTRTIRRDFEALDAAGYLLRVTHGRQYYDARGRWRLARRRAA